MTSTNALTRAPRRRLLPLLLLLICTLAASLLTALPASAITPTGLGTGHLWNGDRASWLGTYRLPDGRQAFCLEAGKSSPIGNEYVTETGSDVFGVSTADHARLAYIARTWAATNDPNTAAAGQLAVWTITGLNGHDQRYYAGRANDQWPVVLQRANEMLAEATAAASRSVSGSVALDLRDDGTGTVRPDLSVDRVAGGPTRLGPTHRGTVTLEGAVFADGRATATPRNGETLTFRATATTPVLTVKAKAEFTGLPYGRIITVGSSAVGSQMILFSGGTSVAASGSDSTEARSPLPFQPQVSTVTSDAVAETGTVLTDQLTVTVAPGDGLLPEWGRYGVGGRWAPVPVTVRSTLLGPFQEPVIESAEWPDEAPVVCEVEVVVTEGPGTYDTPGCELPSGGYYTWVETIDPADTPVDAGRDRVRPWRSVFGSATETTLVPWSPSIATEVVGPQQVLTDTCVSDALVVSGMNPAVDSLDVESLLVGPFPADRVLSEGDDLGPSAELDPTLIAGRVVTTISGDGRHETPCVTVVDPGTYVFILSSEGSTPDESGFSVIPAFEDSLVHESEMVSVVVPEVPEEPQVPSVPEEVEPEPAAAPATDLAFTGGPDGLRAAGLAVGVIGTGLLLVLAAGLVGAARRRSTSAVEAHGVTVGHEAP
jgi:hypothetical protein